MTAQNYPACVKFVRRQEGGNTDVRGDRGGRTGRGGITHSTYDAYRHRKGEALQDVFQITDAEIAEIYHAEYWSPIGGDKFSSGLDLCLFDIAINSGPIRACRIWDAVGGAHANGTAAQIEAVCAERLRFLKSLRSWSQFGRGWSRRVQECEATAMHMAAELDPAAKAHVEKAKVAKAVKKADTHAGGAAAIGGLIAALHQWLGMPGHMALAAGGLIAALVVYTVWRAHVARKALPVPLPPLPSANPLAVQAPPTPPTTPDLHTLAEEVAKILDAEKKS